MSSSFDGSARVWQTRSGRLLYVFRHQSEHGTLFCATFSPDGSKVLTAGGNGLALWDIPSGTRDSAFSPNQYSLCTDAAFSPCGRYVLAACCRYGVLLEARTGRQLRVLARPQRPGIEFLACMFVAFSPGVVMPKRPETLLESADAVGSGGEKGDNDVLEHTDAASGASVGE